MIKFFRKIRQKLLDEGKLSRYLVYAAGEILLVMIGILLALQVNNWNEKNKEREHQLDQLHNLRTEVLSMKQFIQTQMNSLENAKVGSEIFLKLMDSDSPKLISIDSVNTLLVAALNTDLVSSKRLALETEVDFALLPEDKYTRLNRQLLDWKHFSERIGADFQLIENSRENDLQKAIMHIGFPPWMVLFTNFKPSNFSIDVQSLLRSKEIFALLYYRHIRLGTLIRDLDGGLNELDKMLSVLNEN